MNEVKLYNFRYQSMPDGCFGGYRDYIKLFTVLTCYWQLIDNGEVYVCTEEIRDQDVVLWYAALISYAKEDLI